MNKSTLSSTFAAFSLALGLSLTPSSHALAGDELPAYVPVLPQIKARALAVDPQKGYLVTQVKPGVFVITDGIYQSAFVTTGKGVILFDAPPSFAQHIVAAVAGVTQEPIVQLVYSHAHLDHIAGASLLVKQVSGLTIVSGSGYRRVPRGEERFAPPPADHHLQGPPQLEARHHGR